MRRSFVISDFFYRLTHIVKRNRFAVVAYALTSLLFLIIGIAVGINIGDKVEYVSRNSAVVFGFLRGDKGAVAFFFIDLTLTSVYGLFAASMFFHRAAAFLSLAPCFYRSYELGMQSCVILTVFSMPSIPMLFVLYIPVCLAEIFIICMLSYKSFALASLCGGRAPSTVDAKVHYKNTVPFFMAIGVCTLVKVVTLSLFGSALIGVI